MSNFILGLQKGKAVTIENIFRYDTIVNAVSASDNPVDIMGAEDIDKARLKYMLLAARSFMPLVSAVTEKPKQLKTLEQVLEERKVA